MKRLSAVLFPDTVPDEQVLFPLVPVFQPLVYCQPVESEPDQEGCGPLCEEFFRLSLGSRVFPAPLGADRDRFLRLLSDLRNRGGDYAAQLTQVSLASIGSTRSREVETRGTILANLLNSHGIRQAKPDKKTMILWQARLVLKLGEMFDEHQLALRRDMEIIGEKERGLIAELRKEPEHSFAFTEQLFSGPAVNKDRQFLRLKAWSRMFALGQDSPATCRVYVTTDTDAVERLADEYGQMTGNSPEKSVDLQLPAGPGGKTGTISRLQEFAAEAGQYMEQFGLVLHGQDRSSGLQELQSGWRQLVEQYYPAAACGRRTLELYRFPGITARRLFLESFGHDDDVRLLEEEPAADSADIFIGMIS